MNATFAMTWQANIFTVVDIILRTSVVYLFLIGGILLFGKKELAQLSIIDLVFILLISNSVQSSMLGPSDSLWSGLVSAGMLFILNFFLKKVSFRNPQVNRWVEGNPVVLVYQGKIIWSNLEKETITISELEAAAREHGAEKIDEVKLAMLESDGNISVVSYDKATVSMYKRKKKMPARLRGNG